MARRDSFEQTNRKVLKLNKDSQIILFTEVCVDGKFSSDPEERESNGHVLSALQKLFHLTPRTVRLIHEHCDSGIVNAHLLMQRVLTAHRQSREVPPMPHNHDVLPNVEQNYRMVPESSRPVVYMFEYRRFRQTKGPERTRLEKHIQFLEHIWKIDLRTRLKLRQEALWGKRS